MNDFDKPFSPWTLEVLRLQGNCRDQCIRNLPPAIFDRTATTILLEANVMPCPQCGGHKEIPHPDDDGQEGDWRWIPCPTCHDAVSALGRGLIEFAFESYRLALCSAEAVTEAMDSGALKEVAALRSQIEVLESQDDSKVVISRLTEEVETLKSQLERWKKAYKEKIYFYDSPGSPP